MGYNRPANAREGASTTVDPIAVAAAAALANGLKALSPEAREAALEGFKRLNSLMRQRLGNDQTAQRALQRVEEQPDDMEAVERLAESIDVRTQADPEFHRELVQLLEEAKRDTAVGTIAPASSEDIAAGAGEAIAGDAIVGSMVIVGDVQRLHVDPPTRGPDVQLSQDQRTRLESAANNYQQSIRAFRESGDESSQGKALLNLCVVYSELGRLDEALDSGRRGLALFRDLGDRRLEARALLSIGILYSQLGHFEEAKDSCRQSFMRYREAGDRQSEGTALLTMGLLEEAQAHRSSTSTHLRALSYALDYVDMPSWPSQPPQVEAGGQGDEVSYSGVGRVEKRSPEVMAAERRAWILLVLLSLVWGVITIFAFGIPEFPVHPSTALFGLLAIPVLVLTVWTHSHEHRRYPGGSE